MRKFLSVCERLTGLNRDKTLVGIQSFGCFALRTAATVKFC